jgi:hypothetical protein
MLYRGKGCHAELLHGQCRNSGTKGKPHCSAVDRASDGGWCA